jgi:hypothetical protein
LQEDKNKSVSVVVFAWDGSSIPMAQILFDEDRAFELILFNYTGTDKIPDRQYIAHYDQLISLKTEFKGALMQATYELLKNRNDITYIGFVDDDMALSVTGINKLLQIASKHQLDVFQAAIDPSSFYSHEFNVHKPSIEIAFVDWVEIMMPFYRKPIFDRLAPYLGKSISSYGIDMYAVPYVQRVLGMTQTAVIHKVQIKHTKPVTDGIKVFSNKLTARQEGERIRKIILQEIKEQNNQVLFDKFFLKNQYGEGTWRWQAHQRLWKDKIKQWLRW